MKNSEFQIFLVGLSSDFYSLLRKPHLYLLSYLKNIMCTQPVKMDLIKKFLPKQKTIQSFKVDPQGFRKTINENPPTQEFFKNPPEGSEHGQKCIESIKNNTLYYKIPAATPTFCKRNFSRMHHIRNIIFFQSQFCSNFRNL